MGSHQNKINPFSARVYRALCKVPRGKVTTYAELARAAGKPKACRAVGMIMHVNPNAPRVPCHRVVRSNGKLGGFAGGVKKKENMLRTEGVDVRRGRIADFEKKLYKF